MQQHYGLYRRRLPVCRLTSPDPVVFRLLAARWQIGTGYMDRDEDIRADRSHRRLVAQGPGAIPLILEAYAGAGPFERWDLVLAEITGLNPVPHTLRRDPAAVKNAWLRWGLDQYGYQAA